MGNRSSRARRSKPAMRNRGFTSTPPACKRKTTFVYPTCNWDEKHIVRMESQKLIGPREEPSPALEDTCGTYECGICFNAFKNVLNQLTCCKYEICTECYLQLKTPPENVAKPDFVRPERPSLCPYCRTAEFEVIYPPSNIASKIFTTKHARVHEAKTPKTKAKEESVPSRRANSTEALQRAGIQESPPLEDLERSGAADTTANASSVRATLDTASSDESFLVAPRSPPLLPASSRLLRATTPELNASTIKRTDTDGHPVMPPLTI